MKATACCVGTKRSKTCVLLRQLQQRYAEALTASFNLLSQGLTMFTKTSKPLRVPVSSFSPFMITQMGEPTHRSMSSEGMRWLGLPAVAAFFGLIMVTSAVAPQSSLMNVVWQVSRNASGNP